MLRLSLFLCIAAFAHGCGVEADRSALAGAPNVIGDPADSLPEQFPTYTCVDDSDVPVAPEYFPLTLTLERIGIQKPSQPATADFASSEVVFANGGTLSGTASVQIETKPTRLAGALFADVDISARALGLKMSIFGYDTLNGHATLTIWNSGKAKDIFLFLTCKPQSRET